MRQEQTKDIKQRQRIIPMLKGGKSKTRVIEQRQRTKPMFKEDQVIGMPKKKAND